MRRSDREITDRNQIDEILNHAFAIRVAMVDEGEPYLIAMNYAYLDGYIYLHAAKEGRKIDILRRNNKVAFQTDIDAQVVRSETASHCTTKYKSVFGTGRVEFVQDAGEKVKALNAVMIKHTGRSDHEFPQVVVEKTEVLRIVIESLTGKKSQC